MTLGPAVGYAIVVSRGTQFLWAVVLMLICEDCKVPEAYDAVVVQVRFVAMVGVLRAQPVATDSRKVPVVDDTAAIEVRAC